MKNTDNTTNNGGPAFPHRGFRSSIKNHDGTRWEVHNPTSAGMTLRDYFAAAALQGLLADGHGNAWCNDTCSVKAYKLADAMLKARGGAK